MAKKTVRPSASRPDRNRSAPKKHAAKAPRGQGGVTRGAAGARRAKPGAARSGGGPRVPLLRAMLAISLDGYIADKNGEVDWLNAFMSPEIDFPGFMKTIGATIYGRTTFEWAVKHNFLSSGDGAGGNVFVMTRRPIDNLPAGVEVFNGDVRELAARLKRELAGDANKETKDVWLMGGGLSIAPFHEAGLVDRWELSIIPVLLGEGIPLFPNRAHALEELQLVKSRALKNGIVEVWYEPKRGKPAT